MTNFTLNPALKDYQLRFKKEESWNYPPEFFSQLDWRDYAQKLPYVHDVEKFCLRLAQSLEKEEKICIYSDYDTDAVTATAVMYWGLIELGFLPKNLSFYAPDRFTEGYGMNTEAVEKLAREFDLIVSVDCGINSCLEAEIIQKMKAKSQTEALKSAKKGKKTGKKIIKELALDSSEKASEIEISSISLINKEVERKNQFCDLLITDHHHLQADLPVCTGVVNPRLSADWQEYDLDLGLGWSLKTQNFLSSSTTGVGVAWFACLWLAYYLWERQEKGQR